MWLTTHSVVIFSKKANQPSLLNYVNFIKCIENKKSTNLCTEIDQSYRKWGRQEMRWLADGARGDVIGLDLSCSWLYGTIPSNSTRVTFIPKGSHSYWPPSKQLWRWNSRLFSQPSKTHGCLHVWQPAYW